MIKERYTKMIVEPFLRALRSEGEKSLEETMKKSEKASRATVLDALQAEDGRYEKELKDKRTYTADQLGELVAIYSNFVAAEAALGSLRERLARFV